MRVLQFVVRFRNIALDFYCTTIHSIGLSPGHDSVLQPALPTTHGLIRDRKRS